MMISMQCKTMSESKNGIFIQMNDVICCKKKKTLNWIFDVFKTNNGTFLMNAINGQKIYFGCYNDRIKFCFNILLVNLKAKQQKQLLVQTVWYQITLSLKKEKTRRRVYRLLTLKLELIRVSLRSTDFNLNNIGMNSFQLSAFVCFVSPFKIFFFIIKFN